MVTPAGGGSLIAAARARHPLAEVAARTGIMLPTVRGAVTVRCVLPAHGHPDRSPSLRLFLDDGRYFCFGCGSRGDVVQWARELTGTSVREAIRLLDSGAPLRPAWPPGPPGISAGYRPAGHVPAGRSLPAAAPRLDGTPRARVVEVLAEAWAFYTRPACRRQAAGYLAERGIGLGAVEEHTGRAEAGYAPARPDALTGHLVDLGFTACELIDAGVARPRPGGNGLADFYRARVLFPFRDKDGQVTGFAGRDVTGRPDVPKYLNPPRTVVYDKQAADALYRPLSAPGPSGQAVVVEGTTDALAMAAVAITAGDAGWWCPVSPSGLALSAAQLHWLAGLGVPVVLGFDGDNGGRRAAARHAITAAAAGLPVLVTALPGGHDPASWLAEHGEAGLAAFDTRDLTGGPDPRPQPGLPCARTHPESGRRESRPSDPATSPATAGDRPRIAAVTDGPGRTGRPPGPGL